MDTLSLTCKEYQFRFLKPVALQFRRGTAADVTSQTLVPEAGEPIWITDENALYVGDGSTVKGRPIAGTSTVNDSTDVDLSTANIYTIASYSITSNVVTVNTTTNHNFDFYDGSRIAISGSTTTILNGNHVVTGSTASSFTFALTNPDVALTNTDGTVTGQIAPGGMLMWSSVTNKWFDFDVFGFYFTNGIFLDPAKLDKNLDTNAKDIISVGTNDITFNPANGRDVVIKGNAGGYSGRLVLNCENNSHAVKIQGPPHSAGANYTLTLPNGLGDDGDVLSTNATGGLSWAYAGNPQATWIYAATAPTATVASSQKVGQNHGTWSQIESANTNGPSASGFDPNLTGISFDSATGRFSGFTAGRYLVTCELTFTFDNVTPGIGTTLLHFLNCQDLLATYSYTSNLNQYQPLPYTSYGSAAYTATIAMTMVAVCEDSNGTNNIIEIHGDQDMDTSYYVTAAKINFIRLGEI